MKLSEKLKELRIKAGYTKEEMAKGLNLPIKEYKFCEMQNQPLEYGRLVRAADIFGVDIEELMELEVYTEANEEEAVCTCPCSDDEVDHPAHYTAGKVECIDAIESATISLSGLRAVCTGNAIKYLWRWSRKGGLQDVKKARFYVHRLIELLEEDGK